jgi:hypothetical protein
LLAFPNPSSVSGYEQTSLLQSRLKYIKCHKNSFLLVEFNFEKEKETPSNWKLVPVMRFIVRGKTKLPHRNAPPFGKGVG